MNIKIKIVKDKPSKTFTLHTLGGICLFCSGALFILGTTFFDAFIACSLFSLGAILISSEVVEVEDHEP